MNTHDRVEPSDVMLMAIEVSAHKWLVGFTNDSRQLQHEVRAWDVPGLLAGVARARHELGYAPDAEARCCYEAGRDGFSIHRMLEAHGIRNWVLDPASIEVERRRRRRKTDRIDLKKLLALHVRHAFYGQTEGWHWVHVPSIEAEAEMRPQREHETVQGERTRHVNRIRSLLALKGTCVRGVRGIDPAALRDWNGQPLPVTFQQQITRELERLELLDRQVRDIEAEQRRRMRAQATRTDEIAWRLYQLRAIGLQVALVLATEFFSWRAFKNTGEVSGLSGFCGTPYSSGEMWHDQGISKAGNRHVRRVMIQVAWLWLIWQRHSALTRWFHERTAQGGARARRRMIVALARKLLVALWMYSEHGIVPDGAVMKGMRGGMLAA